MINLAVLKHHQSAGVTLALKKLTSSSRLFWAFAFISTENISAVLFMHHILPKRLLLLFMNILIYCDTVFAYLYISTKGLLIYYRRSPNDLGWGQEGPDPPCHHPLLPCMSESTASPASSPLSDTAAKVWRTVVVVAIYSSRRTCSTLEINHKWFNELSYMIKPQLLS